ncbi:uncharacterized protein [Apostichopus japonicus]|uniref:uncharacterized protein n=1 Tax=Stichopus japonicus TaxID=307972 RepID=UPI003AB3D6E1
MPNVKPNLHSYSRQELIDLRTIPRSIPLSHEIIDQIITNGITATNRFKNHRTKRGTKGVKRRRIPVIITSPNYELSRGPGSNTDNLIAIDCTKAPKPIQTVMGNRDHTRSYQQNRGIENQNLLTVKRISAFHRNRKLSFSLWNARSINNKIAALCSSIVENDTDIFAVTETWIGEHRQCAVSEFKASLSGYDVYQRPRANRKGGGVALIIRSDYKVKKMNSGLFKSFEHVDLTVKVNDVTTRIALIYRPPPSRTNGCKTADFLVEFASFLEVLVIAPGRLIILGDFNIHVDNATNGDALKFHDLLCSMNLVQLVRGSTHASGHTLDLVITRSIESPICTISDVTNDNSLPSDHSLIKFITDISRPHATKTTRVIRNIRSIRSDQLVEAIKKYKPVDSDDEYGISVDTLSVNFGKKLSDVMDMLAPAKKKVIVNKARAPWYTDELRLLRNNVRRLERAWLSSPLEINKQIFHGARTSYHDECERAKTQYHRSRIQSANTRKLFAVVDEITGDKKLTGAILPKHNDPQQMAQDFSDFFCGKDQETTRYIP